MRFVVFIIVLLMPFVSSTFAQDDNVLIPNGDPIDRLFEEANTEFEYTFDGQAGKIVTLTANYYGNTGPFNFLMTLIGPDGEEISVEDTSPAMFFSWSIGPLPLPADGVYRLILTNTVPEDVSGVGVRLEVREAPLLTVDETEFSYFYNEYNELPFQIEASAGDRIFIDVIAPDFDAVLTLYDPSGEQIAFDDDSAGNLNPRIGPLQLQSDGRYDVVVTAYDYDGYGAEGRLELRYQVVGPDFWEYGETQTFTLSDEVIKLPFAGQRGEIVSITVDYEGQEVLPVEVKTAGVSAIVAHNVPVNHSMGYGIERFPLPDDANYTMWITPDPEIHIGESTITLERTAEYFIGEVGTDIKLSSKNPNATLIYESEPDAKQWIHIRQEEITPYVESVPFSLRVIQYGEEIATFNVGFTGLDTMEILFGLEENLPPGEVTIEVETEATMPIRMNFRIENAYGIG